MATPAIAPPKKLDPSPRPDMDKAIEELHAHAQKWLEVPLERKIHYLWRAVDLTGQVAQRQVDAAVRALRMNDPAEAWLGGPVIQARVIRLLAESLEEVRRHGTVPISASRVHTRPDGQVKVDVFPTSTLDALQYRGIRAQIWMDRSVTPENLADHVAAQFRDPPTESRVALVLAAGNVPSIGSLDVIHKLFFEGQVVLLKFNPVNEYVAPFQEEVFGELIREGFLRTAYGGGEVGEYLCHHDGIDEIHITGSNITHDIIVFGPGEEGAAAKARNEPRLKKRITSELGNVSPVIVYPGQWSEGDLDYHAENVATQMTQNGGFNCNAAKVLVVHEDWPQREAFLERLGKLLASLEPRHAYYPGAEQRWERYTSAHDNPKSFGEKKPGEVPPTLLLGLDPTKKDTLAFTNESWCAVTGVTALPGEDGAEFLDNAVGFANETLFGTLNAEILIDPRSQKALGPRLEDAISKLRYGTVTTNHWPAVAFGFGTTTWGAFPGHTLDDIQSGIGVVHNTLLFNKPEKSVIYCPFRASPKPPWFVTHRNAAAVAKRATSMEVKPSFLKLPGIIINALRG